MAGDARETKINKRLVGKMLKSGTSIAEIADFLDITVNEVIKIAQDLEK